MEHVKLFSVSSCYEMVLFSVIGNYCYGKLKCVEPNLKITVCYRRSPFWQFSRNLIPSNIHFWQNRSIKRGPARCAVFAQKGITYTCVGSRQELKLTLSPDDHLGAFVFYLIIQNYGNFPFQRDLKNLKQNKNKIHYNCYLGIFARFRTV